MFRGSYSIHILKTNFIGCSEEVTVYISQKQLVRVFRGSYSINILKTNLCDLQRKLHTYLKNKVI